MLLWSISNSATLLFTLGMDGTTCLNTTKSGEIWRSIHIHKIKIIQHPFSKILQTCYLGYFGKDQKTRLKVQHQFRALLDVHLRSFSFHVHFQKIKKIINEKLQIVYPIYFGNGQACSTTCTKEDRINLSCLSAWKINIQKSTVFFTKYCTLKNPVIWLAESILT